MKTQDTAAQNGDELSKTTRRNETVDRGDGEGKVCHIVHCRVE